MQRASACAPVPQTLPVCGPSSSTGCLYGGYPHVALGAAMLATDANNSLVVSGIGSSGNDGVQASTGDSIRVEARFGYLDCAGTCTAASTATGAFLQSTASGTVGALTGKLLAT